MNTQQSSFFSRRGSPTPGLLLLLGLLCGAWLLVACGDDDGQSDAAVTDDASSVGDAQPPTDAEPNPFVDCDEVECSSECVVYVDHAAFSGGDGSSPEQALRRVQDGLTTAQERAGQCCRCEVRVAEGTYHARVSGPGETFLLRERVDLLGGYAANFVGDRDPESHLTVLRGTAVSDEDLHVYHVVTGANDCLLDGFLIEGGRALVDDNDLNADNYGAGLLNLSVSPRVERCVFRDNEALNGGAVYNLDSHAQFHQCRFAENRATNRGGALLNRRSPVLLRYAQVLANEAGEGAGLYNGDTSDASIINSVVAGNIATGPGGGLYNDGSSPSLIHVSLGENEASTGGGLYNADGASPRVVNSILYGDTPDEVVNADAEATPHITYTDVQSGCTVANGCTTDETGNIDANPLYVDRDNFDLRLFHRSPVIDQGDNGAVPADLLTDIDGHARRRDGVTDNAGTVDLGADEARVLAEYPVVHVDQAALGSEDGSSWTDAFRSLEAAFRETAPMSTLWVATGDYVPSDLGDRAQPFEMPNGVLMLGGFDPASGADSLATRDATAHPTVLTGDLFGNDQLGMMDDNSYWIIRAGSPAELDGVTITRARNNNYSGGAGMLLKIGARLWLRHCRFTDNWTRGFGAAIFGQYQVAPVIEHCLFEGNSAGEEAGAIFLAIVDPGARIVHSVFRDNYSPYTAGALYLHRADDLVLEDCLFESNGTDPSGGGTPRGGAITSTSNHLKVTRCVFLNNRGRVGAAVAARYGGDSSVTVEECHFEGNLAHELGNLSWCAPDTYWDSGGGGAIYAHGIPVIIRRSSFVDNEAIMSGANACVDASDPPYTFGMGGAVMVKNGTLDVTGSTFTGNRAEGPAFYGGDGGALAMFGGVLRVSNSHFSGNVAQRVLTGGWGDHGQGGAIWVHAPPDVSDPSQGAWIVNSVLSENVGLWGGGIHLNGGALWIYQSTITLNETGYQNSGGGISNWNGDLYLRNSIVWGNIDPGFYSPTVGQVSPHGYQCDSDTRVFAANTDIMVTGLSPADGCLRDCNDSGPVYGECVNPRHIAPSFVQAGGANADYHHSGAECAELGDNALLPPDWHDLDGDGDTSEPLPVDLDGQPRVVGTVDLGPYERQ